MKYSLLLIEGERSLRLLAGAERLFSNVEASETIREAQDPSTGDSFWIW